MLQLLRTKCWNSAFNAQGSKVIIIVVYVGAVKIYVSAVEALRKKGKTGWNVVYQIWWFSEFHFQGSGAAFVLLYPNININPTNQFQPPK
jgi:NADH:ubiquinone oxidoreductase subunit 6 (subunit J)